MSRRTAVATPFLLAMLGMGSAAVAELPRIQLSADGRSFVTATGDAFFVWGLNYDHDQQGRLIEDYWEDEWERVEADFGEMKQLGANVVRVHLQLGKFMDGANRPNDRSLDQLARLLELAEREALYLDLTGLGCYHRKDVPAWYDQLDEAGRWAAQANFWRAVAARCRQSPAVFCYDLMNEPVVPGGEKPRDDWLGPAFAGKHFVQFIALETRGRSRPEVARRWIDQLVGAIREHDPRRLITVGLVPWSLDRPGLTSGFVPDQVADRLDFIAVHIYPERGKVGEAIGTLAGFDVGKPIVIEETFPLRCTADELQTFIDRSGERASGWIGFYWGQTPTELRQEQTVSAALTLEWLELFERQASRRVKGKF